MKSMYTIHYAFFSTKLGLRGASKEVFAVIFSFWRTKLAPVIIANSIIKLQTGYSDSAIAAAKLLLEAKGLISITPVRGKPSQYSVHLPPSITQDEWTGPSFGGGRKQEANLTRNKRGPDSGFYNYKNKGNNNGKRINPVLFISDTSEFGEDDL